MIITPTLPRVHHGEIRWPFGGKHKGLPVGGLPVAYACWVLDQPDFSPTWKQNLRQVFDLDLPEDDIEPDPASAAVVLPGLIWRWNESLTKRFAADPAALAVLRVALRELGQLCSQYTRKPWSEESEVRA